MFYGIELIRAGWDLFCSRPCCAAIHRNETPEAFYSAEEFADATATGDLPGLDLRDRAYRAFCLHCKEPLDLGPEPADYVRVGDWVRVFDRQTASSGYLEGEVVAIERRRAREDSKLKIRPTLRRCFGRSNTDFKGTFNWVSVRNPRVVKIPKPEYVS